MYENNDNSENEVNELHKWDLIVGHINTYVICANHVRVGCTFPIQMNGKQCPMKIHADSQKKYVGIRTCNNSQQESKIENSSISKANEDRSQGIERTHDESERAIGKMGPVLINNAV